MYFRWSRCISTRGTKISAFLLLVVIVILLYRHVIRTSTTTQEYFLSDGKMVWGQGDDWDLVDHRESLVMLDTHIDTLATSTAENDVTAMSQNPDIQARGEWQMKQVEKYCAKYGLDDVEFQFPQDERERRNLFRHLIFDDSRNLLFCFIPKVGCTTMRRFLFALQGIIPAESIHWDKVDENQYLAPGIQKASFLNSSLTDVERHHKVESYFKFVIIRNPLERLLSAFRDKIEKPLTFDEPVLSKFEKYKREILKQYRNRDLIVWLKQQGNFSLNVTFSEYIQWIVEFGNYPSTNEHFAPITTNSHPCRIKYNFYGNFKVYNSDMAKMSGALNVSFEYFYDKSWHDPATETKAVMESYYMQVEQQLKLQLFQYLTPELDFYYHLCPEERTSHVHVLQINESI